MSGFLDPKESVIDMVLTSVGRKLLLRGELDFTYWIPYDDEVDYSLWQGAGDSDSALRTIEDPLITEASLGYVDVSTMIEDAVNVNLPIFTSMIGTGYSVPFPSMSLTKQEVTIKTRQTSSDGIFSRGDISNGSGIVTAEFKDGTVPSVSSGILITVYHQISGTNYMDEVLPAWSGSARLYRHDIMAREI